MSHHIDIVVARYNEDLTWLIKLPAYLAYASDNIVIDTCFIYNKGNTPIEEVTPMLTRHCKVVVQDLPNIGRESHTYLHHIITTFDTRPSTNLTLFIQGNITDHCINNLSPHMFVKFLIQSAIQNPNGLSTNARTHYPYNVNRRFRIGHYANCDLSPSNYDYGDWFDKFIGTFVDNPMNHIWFVAALFATRNENITRHNIEYYKTVITEFDKLNPEVGHYIERSWYYIFTKPSPKIL
jgi:hypothetical protein